MSNLLLREGFHLLIITLDIAFVHMRMQQWDYAGPCIVYGYHPHF